MRKAFGEIVFQTIELRNSIGKDTLPRFRNLIRFPNKQTPLELRFQASEIYVGLT